MPDLALEYLREIEKDNPSGDVKTLLPLERAKVRLELAQQEEDEGGRESALAGRSTLLSSFRLVILYS